MANRPSFCFFRPCQQRISFFCLESEKKTFRKMRVAKNCIFVARKRLKHEPDGAEKKGARKLNCLLNMFKKRSLDLCVCIVISLPTALIEKQRRKNGKQSPFLPTLFFPVSCYQLLEAFSPCCMHLATLSNFPFYKSQLFFHRRVPDEFLQSQL